MIRSLFLASLLLAGCSKKTDSTPAPDKKLVQAMIDYCKIGNLPADKKVEAQGVWGFQNGGEKEIGPIWNKAARDHDPRAIRIIYAAADAAVGKGNCPIVDVFEKWEPRPK